MKREALIKVLLAMSKLFSEGGEGLPKTLSPLSQSAEHLLQYCVPNNLADALDTLQACAKSGTEDLELMGYEFNRLFIGPGSPVAPPYESVYLSAERLVMQEQTLEVRKVYLAENLSTIAHGREPDDFISTELEFAAYLLTMAVEAKMNENTELEQNYVVSYQRFWREHLALWLGSFVGCIRQEARLPIFIAIAQLLNEILTNRDILVQEEG